MVMRMPPQPPDDDTRAYWDEAARRRRMMGGKAWLQDLKDYARKIVGDNIKYWGYPDITKNVARSIISQLAILYDQRPRLSHPDNGARLKMEAVLDEAGWWQLATSMQRMCLAQREQWVRVSSVSEREALVPLIRVVPMDLVWCEAHPETPDVPHTVWEWRPRLDADGKSVWTIDVLSVADPKEPVWRVLSGDGKIDLSEQYGVTGWPAEWGDSLPGVLYHAQRTGHLRNGFEGAELFEGALRVGVLYTFWMHLVKDCSWPQRILVNSLVSGMDPGADGLPQSVPLDPSAVLQIRDMSPTAQARVEQWEPAGNPVELLGSIQDYAADLAVDFDISPADIQRSHGDARSGYAIFMTREGQRHAQRRYEPQFRRGDLELLAVVGRQLGLPTTGWSIAYPGLPLSVDERTTQVAEYQTRTELGISSPVDLLARLEQIPEDEARERLRQMAADRAEFASQGGSLGAIPLALQQIALARERATTSGDADLAARLGAKMDELLASL